MSYCEYPEFYSEHRVKARKPHLCCETRKLIAVGEHYWRISMKFDGMMCDYCQSEAAYHFARWLNGNSSHPVKATLGAADDEVCLEFCGIGEHVAEVNDDDLTAEWERVKQGEITRPEPAPAMVREGER